MPTEGRNTKVHDDITVLVAYLRERQRSATVATMVAAGIMNPRNASHAIQYGIQHGVLERIKVTGAAPNERIQYRWTGHPLSQVKRGMAVPSFDALLTAWGIPLVPPHRHDRVTAHRAVSDK
jgi:hypothetical protein